MRRRKINNRPGGERDAQKIYILGIIVVVNKQEIMRGKEKVKKYGTV